VKPQTSRICGSSPDKLRVCWPGLRGVERQTVAARAPNAPPRQAAL